MYNGLRIKAKKLYEETTTQLFLAYMEALFFRHNTCGFNDWLIDILANKKVFNAIQESFEVV